MYCCAHCDKLLESRSAFLHHSKACKKHVDTSWIKQEPPDEVTRIGTTSLSNVSPSQSMSTVRSTDTSLSSSSTVTGVRTKFPISCGEIKVEQCSLQLPNSSTSVQQVTTSISESVPLSMMPQFLVTSLGLVKQTGSLGTTYTEPSERTDNQVTLRLSRGRKKKVAVCHATAVLRNICPKMSSSTMASGVVTRQSEMFSTQTEDGVPKIENVYYTSKAVCANEAQCSQPKSTELLVPCLQTPATSAACVSSQQHASSTVLSQSSGSCLVSSGQPAVAGPRTACVNISESYRVAAAQTDPKASTAVKCGHFILPHQTFLPTVQPQTQLQLPQNLQQISTLVPNSPVFVQVPQPLQHNPQTLINIPPALQHNQPVLQQNFGQQNLLLLQTAQPNILQNSMSLQSQGGSHIPMVAPQNIQMQIPCVGQDVKPAPIPQTTLLGATSETSNKTATSSSFQTQTTAAKSAPVASSHAVAISSPQALVTAPRPPVPSPLSVAAPVQMIGMTNPRVPLQLIPTVIPNSNGTGFVLQQMAVANSTGQLPVQQNTLTSSETVSSGCANAVNPLQISEPFQQKPTSNIVLLPPIMSQGHILGGIRLSSSLPVDALSTNACNVQQSIIKQTAETPLAGDLSSPTAVKVPSKNSACQTNISPETSINQTATVSKSNVKRQSVEKSGNCSVQRLPTFVSRQHNYAKKDPVPVCSKLHQVQESGDLSGAEVVLTFMVRKDSPGHSLSAACDYLSESSVLFVSKLILSNQVKNQGPVVLQDGRVFVPIAYTGPYLPKQTSHHLKSNKDGTRKPEKCVPACEVNITELESLIDPSLYDIGTVKVPGRLVWIFLDTDGPKILLKNQLEKNQVMVMPLVNHLPVEALRQVTEMLAKAKMPCPADRTLSCEPRTCPRNEIKKARAALFDRLFDKNKLILPKEGLQKQKVSSPNHPPGLCPAEPGGVQRAVSLLSKKPSALKSLPSQSVSSGLQDKGFNLTSQSKEHSSAQGSTVPVDSMSARMQGFKTSADTRQCQQQTGNISKQPQLTVRADTAVIQRALDAHVKIEKIHLTDALLQQLKVWSKKKLNSQSQAHIARKPPKRKLDSIVSIADTRLGNDVGLTTAVDEDKGIAVKMEVEEKADSFRCCKQRKKRDRAIEWEGNIPSDEGGSYHSTCKRQKDDCSGNKRRNCSVESEPEDGIVHGSTSVTGRRRSIRIFCKPEPNNVHLTQGWKKDDSVNDVHNSVEAESPEEQEIADSEEMVDNSDSVPLTHIHDISSRSLGRHLGFEVYIETDETTEEDAGDWSVAGKSKWDVEKKDTKQKSKVCSVSKEEHSRELDGDFKVLVVQEVKSDMHAQGVMECHTEYHCRICGSFQSLSEEKLVLHLMQHYRGEFSCKSCNFSAASHQKLYEHEALEHTGKPLYYCPVCQFPFFNKAVFRSHVLRHDGDQRRVCHTCLIEVFPSDTALDKHMREAHLEMTKCDHCDQAFKSSEMMKGHYCEGGYPCCQCSTKVCSSEELCSHLESEHGHKDAEIFVCRVDQCHASFIGKEDLEKHTSLHNRLHECMKRLSKQVGGHKDKSPQW